MALTIGLVAAALRRMTSTVIYPVTTLRNFWYNARIRYSRFGTVLAASHHQPLAPCVIRCVIALGHYIWPVVLLWCAQACHSMSQVRNTTYTNSSCSSFHSLQSTRGIHSTFLLEIVNYLTAID